MTSPIASPVVSSPARAARALDRHPLLGVARSTYVLWLTLAVVCSGLMWLMPGDETIPYHIAWAAFALAFGARVWSRTQTWLALAGFTLLTGGILVGRATQGVIAWQETVEIPLMSLLMALLVWNVRRRQEALATAVALADLESRRASDQLLLTRLTSHELRSPLTIATGYLQLLRDSEGDIGRADDLDIVRDEVERISRTTERLLRVIRLQGDTGWEVVDVDAVAREVARRWAGMTDRVWLVDVRAGGLQGSAERLRVVLDTLVENAVRYTVPGDVIRIHASRRPEDDGDWMSVGVADGGRGISPERREALTAEGSTAGFTDPLVGDERTQTGLGLGIVRSVAVSRGGRLVVEGSPEGGAFVWMDVPVGSGGYRPFHPSQTSSQRAAPPPVTTRG